MRREDAIEVDCTEGGDLVDAHTEYGPEGSAIVDSHDLPDGRECAGSGAIVDA